MQMTLKRLADKPPAEEVEAIVVRTARLSPDVKEVELVPGISGQFGTFTAGAHIDVTLPGSIRRCYSLTNRPGETDRYVIAVKKAPAGGGASAYIHDRLKVGDKILVSRPRNAFAVRKEASHSVLLAGGIGITPIWSIIQELSETKQSWELYYTCRTPADAVYLAHIECHAARGGANVTMFHSEQGEWLDLKATIESYAGRPVDFYACGPSPMLAEFRQLVSDLPEERVHFESFGRLVPLVPGSAGAFEVHLARSGLTLQVPENSTLLDCLLDAGIDIDFGCQSGICGTCQTAVLEGVPDHKDNYLSSAEKAAGTTMMVCCSRAKTERLVLDL